VLVVISIVSWEFAQVSTTVSVKAVVPTWVAGLYVKTVPVIVIIKVPTSLGLVDTHEAVLVKGKSVINVVDYPAVPGATDIV
jgi:hypothetical protein